MGQRCFLASLLSLFHLVVTSYLLLILITRTSSCPALLLIFYFFSAISKSDLCDKKGAAPTFSEAPHMP